MQGSDRFGRNYCRSSAPAALTNGRRRDDAMGDGFAAFPVAHGLAEGAGFSRDCEHRNSGNAASEGPHSAGCCHSRRPPCLGSPSDFFLIARLRFRPVARQNLFKTRIECLRQRVVTPHLVWRIVSLVLEAQKLANRNCESTRTSEDSRIEVGAENFCSAVGSHKVRAAW